MRPERGSVAPLIIGLAAVLVLLVAVVVDASAAFLRRQQLDSIADAAALAATDGVQGEAVYTHGLGERARIDPAAARRFVGEYVAASGALERFPGLAFEVHTSADTVVVRLRAPLRLPLRVGDVGPTTTVTGTAASVVVVSD
jgi:Flp pilus assembly protein TadG